MDFNDAIARSSNGEDGNTGFIGLFAGADARAFQFDGGVFDGSHGADFFNADKDFIAFFDDDGAIGEGFNIETEGGVELDEVEEGVGGGVFEVVGTSKVILIGVVEAEMSNGFVETRGGEVEGGFHDLGIVNLSFLELAIDGGLMLVAQHEHAAVFADRQISGIGRKHLNDEMVFHGIG